MSLLLSIVAGGPSDQMYSGGAIAIRSYRPIVGVEDPTPYLTPRWANPSFAYDLTGLPSGLLNVDMDFAETGGETSQTRPEDIYANGEKVFSALDVFSQAGGANRALTKSFQINHSGASSLNLAFVSLNPGKNAFVNIIRVSSFDPSGIPPGMLHDGDSVDSSVSQTLKWLMCGDCDVSGAAVALFTLNLPGGNTLAKCLSVATRIRNGSITKLAGRAELGV